MKEGLFALWRKGISQSRDARFPKAPSVLKVKRVRMHSSAPYIESVFDVRSVAKGIMI